MEVSSGGLVAGDESFAMGLELLVEVGAVGVDDVGVGLLGVVVEVLVHDGGVGLANEVVGVVDEGVSVPGLMGIRGVVAEVLAEVAENCGGLVEHLAVVDDNGELTVGEFTGGLAGTEGWAIEALILKADLCVGEEHTDELNTTVNAEVDDFDV